jgi:hypothetical protein
MKAGRSFETVSGRFHLAYGSDEKTGRPNFPNYVELDANARLIAVAPDLLAEVKTLRAALQDIAEWGKNGSAGTNRCGQIAQRTLDGDYDPYWRKAAQ